jgi:hypothetical protein
VGHPLTLHAISASHVVNALVGSPEAAKAAIILGMPDEVHSDGDYPKDHGLGTRVAILETLVVEIRTDLKAIRTDLTDLKVEFAEMRAEIRGRLTNIPTYFQIVFMLATFAVATFVGATGLALAVLRFGVH